MKRFTTLIGIIISIAAHAQHDSIPLSKPAIDTAAVLRAMSEDIDMLKDLMNEESSYFNISLNVGNELFSNTNLSLNSQQATKHITSLKPGIGYYHKSGLSINGLAYLNLNDSKAGFYQYGITPAYDYTGWKNFAAGISYTRYFTRAKDTLPGFATPYDNEWYGYVNMKTGVLQPGISIGYGTGKYTTVFRGKVMGPMGNPVFVIDSQKTKQADFSVSASVQHVFYWYPFLAKNDDISFVPTLMLNAGSSKITTLAHSNRLVSNIIAKRPNNRFSTGNNGFRVYSVGLSLNVMYETGIFYIQPETYLDYYLLESDRKFTGIFSLTAGVNL